MSDLKARPIHGSFAGPPENGVRFELALRESAPGRAVYVGHAHRPGESLPLTVIAELSAARATIDDSGACAEERRGALEKAAAALVRAATKAELTDGDPVPSKIVRWRAL